MTACPLTVDRQRFVILSSGIGIALCISSTYCFSIFSNSMKTQYHFGQGDITTISTIGEAMGLFSLPAGMLFDFAGPQVVIFLASMMMASGFLLYALAFGGFVDGSLAVFCVGTTLIYWGSGWLDVGSLMTSILNFPKHRGSVVALQKTFMGLGSTILSIIYLAFFENRLEAYAFFMAGVVALFGGAGTCCIRLPSYYATTLQKRNMTEEEKLSSLTKLCDLERVAPSQRRFTVGYVLLTVNLCFLASFSILQAYVDLTREAKIGCAVACVMLFAAFFCLPLVRSEHSITDQRPHEEQAAPIQCERDTQPLMLKADHRGGPSDPKAPSHLPQFQTSFLYNLRHRPLLWCLLWTCFCNIGTGVVIVMNSAQIYRALNNNVFIVSTNTLIVALMGVGSALSRVIVGTIDNTLEKRRMHAVGESLLQSAPLLTALYPVSSLVAILGLIFLLVLPVEAILVPLVLLSMSYGFIWATSALCVRQMFACDVGKHYNWCFFGAVASSIALNRYCFGEVYDNVASTQLDVYPFCRGLVCIRTCMLVLIGLNVSSLGTSVAVHVIYRRHCEREIRLLEEAL